MKSAEHKFQVNVVNILKLNNFFVFSVPNGGHRNILTAINLKKEGVLAGVSDLMVILNNKIVFVELKQNKNKQQLTQKQFQKEVEIRNHPYIVIRDYEELNKFIKKYESIKL